MIPPDTHTSHPSFSHDSIRSLGYDWERIADPNLPAKFPLKVYFPTSTAETIQAIKETYKLGQKLTVRSKGHSSNDLVLSPGGNVLCTEFLTKILDIDIEQCTVKVQSGVILARLDEYLADSGLGLPVIGDHNHITAGGFASVGGISPSSHRFGLFVDNVQAIEFVTWKGDLLCYDRECSSALLRRILTGTGQYGVIVSLTLDLIRVEKWATILSNNRRLFFSFERFSKGTAKAITDPKAAKMERGIWLDFAILNGHLRVGQFSSYRDTNQSIWKSFRNWFSYGYLHTLALLSDYLWSPLNLIPKYFGVLGLVLSPRYASTKNIESFTDSVINESIGDPTRMFVALAPVSAYLEMINRLNELCIAYRKNSQCFTFIALYVKGIKSAYLSEQRNEERYCELMLYLGMRPENMTSSLLEKFVEEIDQLCITYHAFRYLHTKTSKDVNIRRQIDPNAYYASRTQDAPST